MEAFSAVGGSFFQPPSPPPVSPLSPPPPLLLGAPEKDEQIPKLSHPIALRQPWKRRTAAERGGPGGCDEGWREGGETQLPHPLLGAARTRQGGIKKEVLEVRVG